MELCNQSTNKNSDSPDKKHQHSSMGDICTPHQDDSQPYFILGHVFLGYVDFL